MKRLKLIFAQHSHIVRAYFDKLLLGGTIGKSDENSLRDLYYSLNECIVSLLRLDMKSELLSSLLLRQISQRLPHRLQHKWAERAFHIRVFEDPTIFHFESWLKDQIMISKERNIYFSTSGMVLESDQSISSSSSNCELCQNTHRLNKCTLYINKDPRNRLKVVTSNRLCTNCLKAGHEVNDCPSKLTCKVDECSERHHTTLHDAYEIGYSSGNSDSNET